MKNKDVDTKIQFIKAIESVGVKLGTYKLIYKSKGKYGEPECWLYSNPNPKWQKMNRNGAYLVYPDGRPVMESKPGILLELETIKDLDYLKEYLYEFIK